MPGIGGIAWRTRRPATASRWARAGSGTPRAIAHRQRVDVDRLAVQLDLAGDVHRLVEVATSPERRHAQRVRVWCAQPFEDEVGLELAGIVSLYPVLRERLEHLDPVAVRQLDVTEVHRVAVDQRELARHLLVQRGRGRVPHPRAAVADALVEQHLVVEPSSQPPLGVVEGHPERLGLVRVIAVRMELVVVSRQRDDLGSGHVRAGQLRSYIAPDDGRINRSSRTSRFQWYSR